VDDDRCPLTEMLRDGCAHCRKTPDPFATPTRAARVDTGIGPLFAARFAGKCACGNNFPPGEAIRADGLGGYLAPCCHSIGDSR
jgi:hypothetical protein